MKQSVAARTSTMLSSSMNGFSRLLPAAILSLVLAAALPLAAQTAAMTLATGGAPVLFPATNVGAQAAVQNVQLVINSDVTISGISVPQSLGGVQEFVAGPVSGCALDGVTTIPAGAACTVPVSFQPAYPGLRQQPLVVQTSAGKFLLGLVGIGRAPQVAFVPGLITLVAGNGNYGYSGDGGPAASAELNYPNAIAVDAAGNQYIADRANNVIRKVDAVTGLISTVAGNGSSGYSGDSGPATGAQLHAPAGIALDAVGNLYIADDLNYVIRKVDAATGVISTVAGNGTQGYSGDGGPAASAEFIYPGAIALDAAGNLYIVDGDACVVRKVDAGTGVVTTVAGDGHPGYLGDGGAATAAALGWPEGIAVDAAGNLYLADYYNNAVRKVDAVTGVISTVVGDGGPRSEWDEQEELILGPEIPGKELYHPTEIAVDAAGNLYIADSGNGVIKRVDAATGGIRTVAGRGMVGFVGVGGAETTVGLHTPVGIALDAAGDQYIVDANSYIWRVSARGALEVTSSSGPLPAIVSNIGNAPLLISAITLSADFVSSAGTTCLLDTALAAGASCKVEVLATNDGSGNPAGTLTVTDNALNSSGAAQQMQLTVPGPPAAPTFSPLPGLYVETQKTITLTDQTPGITIFYTLDGSTPTTASMVYTKPFTTRATTTVYAIAVSSRLGQSAVAGGTFILGDPPPVVRAAKPTASPDPAVPPNYGLYTSPITVTLADATPGAVIYYSRGDTTEDIPSFVQYVGPITVSSTAELTAYAVADGYAQSEWFDAWYYIQSPPPVLSPAPGTYFTPQLVTLTDAMAGATFYYTTDGSAPSVLSSRYVAPIAVNSTMTIRAIAVGGGLPRSVSSGGKYEIQLVSLAAGTSPTNFPVTPVGAQASLNLSLAVGGDVVIRSISVGPPSAGAPEFALGAISGCAADGVTTIAAGAICTVPVIFQPAYAGTRRSVLVVQTSQGSFSFGLTGMAQAPQVSIAPGVISTVAGTGSGGYTGDGGPALLAQLDVTGGAVDSLGNLFLADATDEVVRKVDALTGMISTVAGNGTWGYGGDGGAATAAQLISPYGVTVDLAGNLYIAEAQSSRIRRVDALTGVISTVAGLGTQSFNGDGGPAIAAGFNWPTSVVIDAQENLYIADTDNYRVRKIDHTTGLISTVAGNGMRGYSGDGLPAVAAQLDSPEAVALDESGNLYITDAGSELIRKVDANTGIISTVAGSVGWSYDGDGKDGEAATSATLHDPSMVTVDVAGDLYLADLKVIRKVDAATGVLSTVAGNYGEFTSPRLIALDVAGNQYIADSGKILKVSSGGRLLFMGGGTVQLARVSNTGNMPLTMTAMTASANFAVDDNTTTCSLAVPLAAGDSCIVGVKYAPVGSSDGTGTLTITDDAMNATGATQQVQLSAPILTAPTLSWIAPAAISYGTELSDTQLNATANMEGTFTYSPAAGTVLDAGVQTLAVTFTPKDTANYASAVMSVPITVKQVAPTVAWNAPAAIPYGTPLSDTQLNATASVPGSFTYTPAVGAVLDGGVHVLSVTFTPTNSDYIPVSKSVYLRVTPIAATLTMTCPPPLGYDGMPHGCAVVARDAEGHDISKAGKFTWAGEGSATNVGVYGMSVTFSGSSVLTATASGTLTITQGLATISCWTEPVQYKAERYDNDFSPCQLKIGTRSLLGSVIYTSVTGARLAEPTVLETLPPLTASAVIKISGATAAANPNYKVKGITSSNPVIIPVLQIPVNIECTYTPVVSYGQTLTASAGLPAQATYGDSGTLACMADTLGSITYTLVNKGTTHMKSTLVKVGGVQTLTFRGAPESIGVVVKAASAYGYAAASRPLEGTNGVTAVVPKPLSVKLNSPTWTYAKGPGHAPLAFSLDTSDGSALAFKDILPAVISSNYTATVITDLTNTPVTLRTSSPIGQYTVTPKLVMSGYAIHPEPGTVTIVPDPTQLYRSVSAVLISTKVGTPKAVNVTVTNKTGEALNLTTVGLENTPFTATPAANCAPLASGTSCTISILFTPTAAGTVPASGTPAITLQINAVDANNDLFGAVGTANYVVFPVLTVSIKGTATK